MVSKMVSKKQHPEYLRSPDGFSRTKIVCTLGPASFTKEAIGRLVESGMSIARLNLTHCTHEFAKEAIENLRSYLSETNSSAPVGVWVDINGPKVRSGKLKDGKPIHLKAGSEFYFVNDANLVGDETQVSTTYTKELVDVGDKIYIDDGILSFTVVERFQDRVKCIVDNDGILGENKGINFPTHIIRELPAVSEKDKADIELALNLNVDFVSISCVRSIEDIEEVRILLGNSKIKLLSKIENQSGMDNFDAILKLSDGIVIDRGYLGAEVDVEIVTTEQKKMISKANATGKSVMISNQMLESMKDHPRPTRSESADISNAVLDGVDGLVLSAETAVGHYVVESLLTMRRIASHAEKNCNYLDYQARQMRSVPKPIGVSESIASSAVTCARQVEAAVIICLTELGGTARLVAKYRPNIPVIASTTVAATARQLSASFGLIARHHDGDVDHILQDTMQFAVEIGLAKPGDVCVVTSGQQLGFLEGTTTKMQVLTIPKK